MDKKQKLQGLFWDGDIEANYIGHQLSEIYRDNVYAPFLQGKKDLTIADVGANLGITSYYFSQFANKVYSVEPSREHFKVLTHMLKHNEVENVIPINKAIYIKDGQYPLYHNKNKTMFSLHAAVNDSSSPLEQVTAITLPQLIKEHKIKEIDLMKVDIEGTEVELFSSSSFLDVAPKINTIITESHQWSGRHPQQLIDALKHAGYEVSNVPSSAELIVARR